MVQVYNHQAILALDKKVGPKPPYDERRPPSPEDPIYPKKYWDQTMYGSFSRTRSDFVGLKKIPHPVQEP